LPTQTTSEHRVLEAAVLAAEIEQLADMQGSLKFASQMCDAQRRHSRMRIHHFGAGAELRAVCLWRRASTNFGSTRAFVRCSRSSVCGRSIHPRAAACSSSPRVPITASPLLRGGLPSGAIVHEHGGCTDLTRKTDRFELADVHLERWVERGHGPGLKLWLG
jgi:hypothetical protein